MKTMLRIGLILGGVFTIWVACSAKDRHQSLTTASHPSPEIQNLTAALSGEWSLNVKFEPDAATPNGLVNTEKKRGAQAPADTR